MAGIHSGTTLNVVDWVFTSVSTVLVCLRLISRFGLSRMAGADDWAIIVAFIVNIGYAISLSVGVHNGLGQHVIDIPLPDTSKAVLSTIVASSFSIWSFAVPKLAVALLIARVISLNRWATGALLGLAIFDNVVAVVGSILFWNSCSPPAAAWDPMAHPGATCLDPKILAGYAYFLAALSGFLDFVLALFPGYMFWQLDMKTDKKIAVSLLMGLGFFAGIIALYKCSSISGLEDPQDLTYSAVPLLLWSSLEANLVIIAACIPTLPNFFRGARSMLSSRWSSEYSSSSEPKKSKDTGKQRFQLDRPLNTTFDPALSFDPNATRFDPNATRFDPRHDPEQPYFSSTSSTPSKRSADEEMAYSPV